jgi:hypothetical protein
MIINDTYSQLKALLESAEDPQRFTNEESERIIRATWNLFRKGEFWKKNQDLYKSPKNYMEWNECVAARIFMSDKKTADILASKNDKAGVTVSNLAGLSLDQPTPARYISASLTESFLKTPYPEITEELLEIYPQMIVMLPKGSLITMDNTEVKFMIIQTGRLHPVFTPETRKALEARYGKDSLIEKRREGAMGIMIAAITTNCNYTWIRYLDPSLNDLGMNPDMDTETKSSIEAIARVGVNSLLVHLYEPELITTDSPESVRRGFGADPKGTRTMPPTWIGKLFRRVEQRQTRAAQAIGRSPRTHWRRGHWHTVVCGKGRQEREMRWFRPTLVNAST